MILLVLLLPAGTRAEQNFSHASSEVFRKEGVQEGVDSRVEVSGEERQRREEGAEIRVAVIAGRPVLPHLPCVEWQVAYGKGADDDDQHLDDATSGSQHVLAGVRVG